VDILLGKSTVHWGRHDQRLIPAKAEGSLEGHAYFIWDFFNVGINEYCSFIGKSQFL